MINEYTGSLYRRINPGLLSGSTDKHIMQGAHALNEALEKMPKHKGTVYRSTQPNGTWNADYVDAKFIQGETTTLRNFQSSSTQDSASFGGGIKFVIKSKGNNGAIIGHIGQFGTSEMEVLWKAGSRFKVIKKQRTGSGGIKIWMEEV